MRAAIFREDDIGVVVGRLVNPNEIVYEDNGLKRFYLLNAIETEYNDVFILGKRISEDTLEVRKMESLPQEGDSLLGFKTLERQEQIYCLAIPKDKISSIEEKYTENGTSYHKFHIVINKNTTMHLNIFGEISSPATGCYVFLLKNALTEEKREFGEGYAIKKVITKYGAGYQILS